MSNSQRPRGDRDRKINDAISSLGLTHAEASLFHVIHYGITIPESELPRWGAGDFYSLAGSCSEEECRVALSDCLKKGWLQVITESSLTQIQNELREQAFLGPVYGFPEVGHVDFTNLGAELWQQLSQRCFAHLDSPPFAYSDVVYQKTARYFKTETAAAKAIASARQEPDVVSATGPFPIGPWRVQWWRRFPEGYRIEIEERWQWQGRCSELSESFYIDKNSENADPNRLREILDCNNVTPGEWAVMAAVEVGPQTSNSSHLARIVWDLNGRRISEADCGTALESCLRYGWLRILNSEALDQIHEFIRTAPALPVLPKLAALRREGCVYVPDPATPGQLIPKPFSANEYWGDVDFTPAGADLYQRLLAEWLGPDSDDRLSVSRAYSSEEHRYCESAEPFPDIIQEHEARGAIVHATRIIEIGPWCVYWWQQFPAGYRLELELSDL
ncbi:MAG: hypothetical protein JSS02_11235 [Planctomycetes bacterium]|nr:hypothetical protein [Planctomycetota bacterium]